jgi:hypothetical protein
MKTTVEASLLPILRSRGQAEILCAVLANPNREWTLDSDWKRFPFRPEAPIFNSSGERK